MIKKAMILAAGFGKRLNPLTLNCPKPLLQIGQKTLLSNTINFLEQSGIKKVVINIHYLGNQITDYLNDKKFNLDISIVDEKEKILNTGGGILNALEHFDESFLCINPDTIWNSDYIMEFKKMEEHFFARNTKCILLVVNKKKSFDQSLKGDFDLQKNLISRGKDYNLEYIYTGLQILKPEIFLNTNERVFSINKIWDKLIKQRKLFGMESNINFLHVSTLDIYKNLKIK